MVGARVNPWRGAGSMDGRAGCGGVGRRRSGGDARRAGSLRSPDAGVGPSEARQPTHPPHPPPTPPEPSRLRPFRPRASAYATGPAPPHAQPPSGLRAVDVNPESVVVLPPPPFDRLRVLGGRGRSRHGGRSRPWWSMGGIGRWLNRCALRSPRSGRLEGRAPTTTITDVDVRPLADRAVAGRGVSPGRGVSAGERCRRWWSTGWDWAVVEPMRPEEPAQRASRRAGSNHEHQQC